MPSISIATESEEDEEDEEAEEAEKYDPETFENEHSYEDKNFVAHQMHDAVHVQQVGNRSFLLIKIYFKIQRFQSFFN